jgi:dolichyl-diphosphooligosaccharide--protein glycosyltransferase
MLRGAVAYAVQFVVVVLSCVLSFAIRLFANVKHEPLIHEFDPQFNWRCTQYIDSHGLYAFLGWFDNFSWYPQGRPVGETAYPGLMAIVATTKWTLQRLHIAVDLITICIYAGPCFAVAMTLVSFLYGRLLQDSTLGVTFAGIVSFTSGLISRSETGAYDYECGSICLMIACIYTFSLALKTGSVFFSVLAAFVYGCMAATWGGYVFIANCIPLFVAVLIAIGRYSWRLHITYSIWVVLGSLLMSSIPFIGQKIVQKPEHFAMLGVFGLLQIWGLFTHLHRTLSAKSFATIVVSLILALPLLLFGVITVGISTGLLGAFSGRLMQFFDPSYASKHIPIIASVAEHRMPDWSSFFMNCDFFLIVFPLGCFLVLREKPTQSNELLYLLLIYGLSTIYFASVMVRLILVATPGVAYLSALAFRRLIPAAMRSGRSLASVLVGTSFILCVCSLAHATSLASDFYSDNQILFSVFSPRGWTSSDDYREGYRWLWENTGINERVMSWWDYGYQITVLAGRACHADGNTNNFTHIGIIGMTMSTRETRSWRLARMMEADYMLVIFGGACAYLGDDISKFMWMPRIANQTFTNISGRMYESRQLVGPGMTSKMADSMMFKMCYHNFDRLKIHPNFPDTFDIARQTQIPNVNFKLSQFEEAFTTQHWIMRIYRVMPDLQWDRVY